MNCRLFGAKPLSEIWVNYPSQLADFQENALENVCRMAAILFQSRCILAVCDIMHSYKIPKRNQHLEWECA